MAKHEVSFEDAATVFGDPLGWVVTDPRHSLGKTALCYWDGRRGQRLLAVMYAERDEAIRIISARRATRREQRNYEENAH